MKLSSLTILATVSLSLAACNSLDNPLSGLFRSTGHDGRVYNAQTGEWEWPPEKRAAQEKKSGAVASALAATPAPHGFNDTRYWDAQRNQWVEGDQTRTSSPSKPKPTPPPADAAAAATTTAPMAPAPAPVRGTRSTGVYNSSTGKIEWQTSDTNVPHGAVAPEPKKHWYWPF